MDREPENRQYPPDVHHREAEKPEYSCGTCGYFAKNAGRCMMFKGDPPTDADDVCDKWTKSRPVGPR